jgi:prepilin-type N-terminal cleavage/methylation domain-containing protein
MDLGHTASRGNDEVGKRKLEGGKIRIPPSPFRLPTSAFPLQPSVAARPRAAAGFTLLEILVAVLILAIVVTTVLSSFNMVFSNAETLETSADMFEMGRNCLTRMTRDLENVFILERPLYKTPAMDSPLDPYRLQGSVDNLGGTRLAKLRFTSRAHVPLDRSTTGGIAEVVYYVQPVAGGSLRLKRADNLYPYPKFEERGVDPVLCENVKSLAFEYVDAEGKVFETWDSESSQFGYAIPVMVAVKLEIGDGDEGYGFQTTVALPIVRPKSG